MIPLKLMKAWGDSEHCIALVEQAALILGIIGFRAENQEGDPPWWFEDNSAVLSGLVRGSSWHPTLDAGATTIHLLLAERAIKLECWGHSREHRERPDCWLLTHGLRPTASP